MPAILTAPILGVLSLGGSLRFAGRFVSNITMLTAARFLLCLVTAFAVVVLAGTPRCFGADAAAALKGALARSVGHATRWLDERDYKSLVQSTGGILLLTEVLKAKGDDPDWQAGLQDVLARTREVQAAAREEDLARCKSGLDAVGAAIGRIEKAAPAGKALELPKAAIRPLMLTLDSLQADAKVALLTGNVPTAKNQAAVLAELSRLVSNSRTTETWSGLAADFQKACEAAASSSETDPKVVRQLFRGIAERCEACHENSRQK